MHLILSATCLLLAITASAEIQQPQKEEEQEIRVHLATTNPLTPVYFGKLQAQNSTLTADYLSQLETVLFFDLNYNGSTKVLPKNQQKEELLASADQAAAFNGELWKNFGVACVMKGAIEKNQLTVMLFSVSSGTLKSFKDIPLTGNLNQDRKQIHKLADGIHFALFNKPGIANTRILYSAQAKASQNDRNTWVSEIWECDWDGGNARQITHEKSYCVTPVFVPTDSKYANERFLYVSYKQGQPKIYIASLKEGVGKRFIDLRGNQLLPAMSSKRDKMAFISDASGRTDLFLVHLHPLKGDIGKPIQLYSFPRATQASPTFSPDGSKIAFVSDKDGAARIYLIPAVVSQKRSTPTLITKQNPESSCPSWAPDGTKLAYSAKTNGVRQIWIYDFVTKEERQVTTGSGHKENPAWAPDSLHLVFNSTDGDASELYIVNLNQPEAIKITRGQGKKHYPSWGTR